MGNHHRMEMKASSFVFLSLLAVAAAVPGVLDDADSLVDVEAHTVVQLQAKLAKLEHTFERIKKSCVANNVPHELGEAMKDEKKAPATVSALEAAIKKKNAAIDKITDACMPGEEEVLIEEDETNVNKLKAKLAKLEHTFKRVKKSCVANDVPTLLMGEGMDGKDHQKTTNRALEHPKTTAEFHAAIKAKNAAIDKIADACMPGMADATDV